MESPTDAISEAKAKANSPWLIMGGDWNRYNTKLITDTFTDLIKRNTEATRGTAVLDYSFTNFESMITESEVCFPLERIDNASKFDHHAITYECLLSRPASFVWETHEYVKITKDGTEKFGNLIRTKTGTR